MLQTTVSSAPTHICIRPHLPALQTHPAVHGAFQIPAPAHSVTPAASVAPIAAIKAAAATALRQASADMIACEAALESDGAGGAGSAVSKCFAAPPSPAEPAGFSFVQPLRVVLGLSHVGTRTESRPSWSTSPLHAPRLLLVRPGLSRISESPDVPAGSSAERLASRHQETGNEE